MPTTLPEYEHEELKSLTTIRLIRVHEKNDNQIACTISHVEQTAEETKYDALSYVWGDPELSRKIRIRNSSGSEWYMFRVHENLWQFLNSAWVQKNFDRWFWIDQICLDQSHGSNEKADQIPRMADIYHNAERVVAWIGFTAEQCEDWVVANRRKYEEMLTSILQEYGKRI